MIKVTGGPRELSMPGSGYGQPCPRALGTPIGESLGEQSNSALQLHSGSVEVLRGCWAANCGLQDSCLLCCC